MAAATLQLAEDRVWNWVLEQRQRQLSLCGELGEQWTDDSDSDETQRLRSHFSVASSVVSEEEDEEAEAGEQPALARASFEFGLDDLVREIEDWQAADALQQRAMDASIELTEQRPSSAGNEATHEPRAQRIRWPRGNCGEHDDGTMLVEPLLVLGHERAPAYDLPEPRSAALPDRQPQPFVARRALSLPTISPSTLLAQTSAPPLFSAGPPAEPLPINMASRKHNGTIAPSSYSPPSASSKLRSRSSDMDLRAAFSNSKRPALLRGPASSESSTTTTSSSTHSARGHFPLLPHMDSISALLRSRASVTLESRASALKISAPLTAPSTPPKQLHQHGHARSPSGSSVSESSCDSDSVGVLTPNTSYTNIRAVSPQLHGRPAKFNLDRALPPLPPLDANAKRPFSQLPPPRPMSTTPYSPAQSKPVPPPVQRPKRPPLNKRQISLPMSVDVAVAEQILATPPRAAPSPLDYLYPHDLDEPLPQSANPYALVEAKRGRRLSDVPAGLVRTLSRSNSSSRPTSPTRSPPVRRPKNSAPPSAFANPLSSARASQISLDLNRNLGEATRGLRRVLSFSRPRTESPEPISPAPVSAPLPPSPPAKDKLSPQPEDEWDSDSEFELVTAPRGYFAYSQSSQLSTSNSSASPKPKRHDALLIRAPARAKEISFEAVRQWAAREGEIGRMEAVGKRGVRVVFREAGVCGRWCVRGKGEVFVEGVGNVALEVVQVK